MLTDNNGALSDDTKLTPGQLVEEVAEIIVMFVSAFHLLHG
jgi:hypothetical protein